MTFENLISRWKNNSKWERQKALDFCFRDRFK
jgi:hypothetical protein